MTDYHHAKFLFDFFTLLLLDSPTAFNNMNNMVCRRTSKNQRKAQRKKWSLKEGSKFEDLALLDEIKKLVLRLDSLRGIFNA